MSRKGRVGWNEKKESKTTEQQPHKTEEHNRALNDSEKKEEEKNKETKRKRCKQQQCCSIKRYKAITGSAQSAGRGRDVSYSQNPQH